ncbi:MAG: response regulator [Bacilli bacterium]|jgi:two-component SAPR family response regulator|nr:response regulator [Bacilli bacterium]MDY0064466.1 response regulator [Bacilli bacterium]
MIRTVIIDDEQLAVNNLHYFLKQFDDLEIVGTFTEVEPFLACLKEQNIQLVFMDIEMPEMNGLNLAATVIEDYQEIEIVFATAYNQYAVQAFELNAIDYILKPLSFARIEKTIEKIRKRIPKNRDNKVFIKCLGGFDIYVNDQLINFKLSKAKEVLAYLIQNMGKSMGWMTIADDVWPDSLDDKKLMNNFHVANFSLRTFLSDNGIAPIFDYSRNVYRVDPTKFECDYYKLVDTYKEYRKTKEIKTHPETFKTGEYLENLPYTWSIQTAEKVEEMIQELERAIRMKRF